MSEPAEPTPNDDDYVFRPLGARIAAGLRWLIVGPLDLILAGLGVTIFLVGWGVAIWTAIDPGSFSVARVGGLQGRFQQAVGIGAGMTTASAVLFIAAALFRSSRDKKSEAGVSGTEPDRTAGLSE